MRASTVIGPLKETGPQEYAHTPHSLVYTIPALEAGLRLMYVAILNSKSYQAADMTGPTNT